MSIAEECPYFEIAKILLSSQNCWTNNKPEIPEEISAQFDIPLSDARRICELAEKPCVCSK